MDYSKIRAFAFDVDGVFTDGSIISTGDGDLLRIFNSKDGFAVRMAGMRGYPVAIITGGRSKSVTNRFVGNGVTEDNVYLGSRKKTIELADFCQRNGLDPQEVMFIGDDIPDIAAMQMSGIGLCPSDAAPEVREAADVVSEYPGGKGCVRNAVEKVLRSRGDWNFDADLYKKLY